MEGNIGFEFLIDMDIFSFGEWNIYFSKQIRLKRGEKMGTRKFTIMSIASILVFLILHFPGPGAFAQGNLKLGRLAITPSFEYDLLYEDNIFFTPTNEQDDISNRISPRVVASYAGSTPGNFFLAGYDGEWNFYSDFSDQNWTRQNGFANFGYASPKGFYLEANENFNYSEDPFGSFNEFEQSTQFGLGEQTKRWDNMARILGGYNFSNVWFAETGYENYVIRYDLDKDNWQDRMDHRFFGSAFYRVTSKTALTARYVGVMSDYNKQNDGVFDTGRNTNWSSDTSQDYYDSEVLAGARFEPGGKFGGEALLGYGTRQWDNSADPLGNPYKDWSGLVVRTYATYSPTDRTTLLLNFQRSPLGSPDADSAMFVNTLIQLKVTHEFAYRLSAHLLGGYNYDDYQDEAPGRPSKYFELWTFTGGLDWNWKKWLKIGFLYELRDQSVSNKEFYGSSEFTYNQVKGYVEFTY